MSHMPLADIRELTGAVGLVVLWREAHEAQESRSFHLAGRFPIRSS